MTLCLCMHNASPNNDEDTLSHEFRFVKEMSETDIDAWNAINRKLFELRKDNELISIVSLNYDDFKILIKRTIDEFAARNFDPLDCSIRINQYVLNILSASIIFLSHTKYNIDRRHGKDSELASIYRNATSSAYDTHFAYRFLYKLRNYTQHCGIPVINTRFHTKSIPDSPDMTQYVIDITVNKQALLVDRSYLGKVVAAEVDLLPNAIPLLEYIDEFMGCINEIYRTILAADADEIRKLVNILDALLQPTGSHASLVMVDYRHCERRR